MKVKLYIGFFFSSSSSATFGSNTHLELLSEMMHTFCYYNYTQVTHILFLNKH